MVKELTGGTRPALLFEDKNGAILIARHNYVGPRTKHIESGSITSEAYNLTT